MAIDAKQKITILNVINTETVSAAFQLERWARHVGVLVPALDDGAVTVTVCATLAGTYYPVMRSLDGTDLVLGVSGQDPFFADITEWVMSVPSTWYFKFLMAAQSPTVDLTLVQKGWDS
jgi:hypothetical protein